MIAVSSAFKNAMKNPVKELDGYLNSTGHNITSSDDLVSIKISCDSSLCKSSMRKLEAKYIGDYDLLDKWVHPGFGVKINNAYEYLDYGSFKVTEITYSADTNMTTIVGYDKMINSMTPYSRLQVAYPINLLNYTTALCNACGLTLGNVSLPTMNNWQVNEELWENINGITYRDIIVQIAQVTGSTAIISNDDKIYFKPITATSENLTYSNLLKLKLYPKYGPINSVILSRTPQEDNIYEQDPESIAEYGLTEWKIENNEIVDKDRDNALPDIYDAMEGIEFYPFEVTTEGLGWYEVADNIDIVNNSNDTFNTTIFNYSITIDGGIKETLKTSAENKTQTQYQYASKIEKRINNTELIVNKQDGEIKALTTKVDSIEGFDGYTKEQTNELIQTATTGLTNKFINTGGNNIFRNTGLWFEDNSTVDELICSNSLICNDDLILKAEAYYEYWDGKVSKMKEEKASNQSALLLQNNLLTQTQQVRNGKYTICFKYEKLVSLAGGYVTINGIQEELTEESGEYIKTIDVSSQNISVGFTCDTDNGIEIYDLMVNVGEEKAEYAQNENETTTDTVNIGKGITITSSDTNTTFKADSDGIRVFNSRDLEDPITDFTDIGMTTKKAIVENEAEIVGVLFKIQGNNTWITKL